MHATTGYLVRIFIFFFITPGLHAPRVSEFASKPLPTAREASIAISAASGITEFNTTGRLSEVDSLLLMQVGQFLDHDYALSPIPGKRLLTSQLYISGGSDISNFAPVQSLTCNCYFKVGLTLEPTCTANKPLTAW